MTNCTTKSVDAANCFINSVDAAKYLGITKKALETMRREGGGPVFHRLGHRTVRYRLTELNAWAEERTYTSTAEYPDRDDA